MPRDLFATERNVVGMKKVFNVTADCKPSLHYMVDITERLRQIKDMVDRGEYFTINRARQYGKTTTLRALEDFLKDDYLVVSLDFQAFSNEDFKDERSFVQTFSREILEALDSVESIMTEPRSWFESCSREKEENVSLSVLFQYLMMWCRQSEKRIVLLIDEVDSASNNQVFMDFLALLRRYYIIRDKKKTFQSVILAGVYDIKNLKRKLRPEDAHRMNSPWNIAAEFRVDMSFSKKDISGMLSQYEEDYHTGMDVERMAGLLYDYTSGYPFLVSCLCKLIDEQVPCNSVYPDKKSAWTKKGFLKAVRILLAEKNTLFESLAGKLTDYPELKKMMYAILFSGEKITYNPDNPIIDMAAMFGFIRNENSRLAVANRIFEVRIYNFFLSEEEVNSRIYIEGSIEKSRFIKEGRLNMRLVLERFVACWEELYRQEDEPFIEKNGRKFFLLFLRPIINGTGNYYIEAETRDSKRTDVIVDYLGEQFVIELKICHGDEYNRRGEAQLAEYLDYYNLKKGYMLSFNFNKKKKTGVKEIELEDKILIEAVV